jgi:pimeloyl-ACP methyl ester carboxylesterase
MSELTLRFVPLYLVWIVVSPLWPLTIATRVCAQELGKQAIVELLPPSGPLSVGRTSYHWINAHRERPGAEGGTKSEIMVHIWHPAKTQAAETSAPYIPGFATLQAAIGEDKLKEAAEGSYDALSSARTHVVADAPVSSEANKYPVLLLSHGLRYNSLGYSMLGEDLASHGYVVVGIDHPSTAFAVLFPDDRVTLFDESLWTKRRTAEETSSFERKYVDLCAADLVFALDQLERLESGALPSRFQGRLDLARVGVFGHSFGGRNAAKACQLDKRLKAAVVSDAFGLVMTVDKNPDGSTLDQPVMIQYARRVPRAGIPKLLALLQTPGRDLEGELGSVRKEFCESVKGVSYEVTLSTPGIVHESLSDMPFLESGQDDATRKNRQRAIEITRLYTRVFFDRHLRALPAPLLDNAPDNAEEVELIRHTFRGL